MWRLGALVVLSPFVYSLYWVAFRLEPIEMVDAFPYLWDAPLSAPYFTGRSLTQRVLYSLCREDPRTIAIAQLTGAALTALGAYLLLLDRDRPSRSLVVAAAIAFLATSFNTSLGAIALIPEPIHLELSIAFPLVLVYARGVLRIPCILAIGILTIFSKNTAPAIVLAEIAAYGAVRAVREDCSRGVAVKALFPYAALALCAFSSMAVSQRWDTSVELNAANDVFRRVLPDPIAVLHFHARHDMPESPAIDELRGQYATSKLGGRAIFRINHATRNYELVPGDDPFLRWVAEDGFGHYVRHILFHEPMSTCTTLNRALTDLYAADTVTLLSRYTQSHAVDRKAAHDNARLLHGPRYHVTEFDERHYLDDNPDVADAVRRGAIPSGREHYERYGRLEGRLAGAEDSGRSLPEGLFLFDPIGVSTAIFAAAKFNRLWALLPLILGAAYAARRFPKVRGFALSGVLLVGSLTGFFLGYFGDAMEMERHVWTPVITLTMAFVVLTGTVSSVGLFVLRSRLRAEPDVRVPDKIAARAVTRS